MRPNKADGPVADSTQNSHSILERSYQYNKAGQIAKIEDSLRGTRSYHYDALDRLTQVDGPNPEYFVHDPAHNILATANSKDEAKQQASATQVKGNRLAFRGDTHYRYDIHGNRIAELRGKGQKLQTRYHYNTRQQLVWVEKLKLEEGVEQLQKKIHYQYDPLGRRIGKSTTSEYTNFLWDGDVLLRENKSDIYTQQDLNTRTYYFEPGTFKPVALKEGKQEKEQIYHYHLDHLGTPDTLTNQEGEVVWSVAYKSYGNVALAHENQIEQPIRFQGQYFDEETGLHYNRFRYYDPKVGEFTQQDPIGLLGGSNNYRYVPNPVAWIDPYGLEAKEVGTVCPGSSNKRSLLSRMKAIFTGKSDNPTRVETSDTPQILDKSHVIEEVNSSESIGDVYIRDLAGNKILLEPDFGPIMRGISIPENLAPEEFLANIKATGGGEQKGDLFDISVQVEPSTYPHLRSRNGLTGASDSARVAQEFELSDGNAEQGLVFHLVNEPNYNAADAYEKAGKLQPYSTERESSIKQGWNWDNVKSVDVVKNKGRTRRGVLKVNIDKTYSKDDLDKI